LLETNLRLLSHIHSLISLYMKLNTGMALAMWVGINTQWYQVMTTGLLCYWLQLL